MLFQDALWYQEVRNWIRQKTSRTSHTHPYLHIVNLESWCRQCQKPQEKGPTNLTTITAASSVYQDTLNTQKDALDTICVDVTIQTQATTSKYLARSVVTATAWATLTAYAGSPILTDENIEHSRGWSCIHPYRHKGSATWCWDSRSRSRGEQAHS